MNKIIIALVFLISNFSNSQNFNVDIAYGINGVFAPSHFKANHQNLGIGYEFNETYGLRLDIASDKFVYDDNTFTGTKNLRVTLNGVLNVLNFLDLKNRRDNFDLDAHIGVGYSDFKSNNYDNLKPDNIVNVVFGLTPKYWLTDKIGLKTSFTTVMNLSQHYLFDGQLTYTGTPNGITGLYYNINLGLIYKI